MASNNLQCDTGFKIRTGDTTGISNGNAYAPPWAGDDWDGQATKTILKYCCKYTCYHHMTSNSLQCPEGSTMRNKWDDRCAAAIARAAHPRRASRPPHRATPLPLGGSS